MGRVSSVTVTSTVPSVIVWTSSQPMMPCLVRSLAEATSASRIRFLGLPLRGRPTPTKPLLVVKTMRPFWSK